MLQLAGSTFSGITLAQCGLLFMATPHTGTTKADWDTFVVAVANTVTGVRSEVVSHLKAFSPASVWDKQAFLNLDARPPFRCYAEGRKLRVRGTDQHVRFAPYQ
jgi:hypothetical protein